MITRRDLTRRAAALAAGASALAATPAAAAKRASTSRSAIDRKALVRRHAIVRTQSDPETPLQVGNGHFAFGADVTGLQTFQPYATLSDWGWHTDPLPPGTSPRDFQGQTWDTNGRPVRYAMPDPAHPEISQWLISSPNRANLGRIGLRLRTRDGHVATEADLTDRHQRLDLWTGVLRSSFRFEGVPVTVETTCHPRVDALGVRVDSALVADGRLAVEIELPYAVGGRTKFAAPSVGVYDRPAAHASTLGRLGDGRGKATIRHELDDLTYHVALRWQAGGHVTRDAARPHVYVVAGRGDRLHVSALFSKTAGREAPAPAAIAAESARRWPAFWRSGGAIDLSGSRDRRWRELERRIVHSQYLTAVNGAGSTPPQESGLVNNGWYGKFHMEMYWWHGAHFALWNRWPLLRRSLGVYDRLLPRAVELAKGQGYAGARWQKMTSPDGEQTPGEINALLAWQQPHPLFFAELDHRAHPGRRTLLRWKDVVFATADFMASYPVRDPKTGRRVLGPPVYPVSENTKPRETKNPAFELSYWRFGLRIAQEWRRRLGLKPDPRWQRVLDELAPLPQEDGRYVLYEGVEDMWTAFNFEHPALTGIYGWLPGDGVDPKVAARTTDKIDAVWKLDEMWGWDFPMMAMNAARLGRPERAVELLLHPQFKFRDNGMPTGGAQVPVPYFPASGGLLYAVAMMAAGWDGSGDRKAPGFPRDWVVRAEGLSRAV